MDQPPSIPSQPAPLPPGAFVGQTPNIPFDPSSASNIYDPAPPRRTPIWLWVITLSLLAVLVVMQRPEEADPKELREAAAGINPITAPDTSEFILVAKFMYGAPDLFKGLGAPQSECDQFAAMSMQFADQFAGWTGKDKAKPVGAANPPRLNKHPAAAADRLRAAILAGEVLDKDEVEWRIHDVEQSLDASSDLREDARIVRIIYSLPPASPAAAPAPAADKAPIASPPADPNAPEEDADADQPNSSAPMLLPIHHASSEELAASHEAATALSDADKQAFRKRHGWFADLALSRGDDKSTVRKSATSDGVTLILFFCIIGAIISTAFLVGLVLLIVGFVKLSKGTLGWRLKRPHIPTEWPPHEEAAHDPITNPFPRRIALATPGSVWLETVAVFFALFLGVKLAVGGIGHVLHWDAATKTAVLLGAQWLVALSIFWPIVRGMPFSRWRAEIGWKSERGFFREVFAGACGYLAGLPVYFGVAVVVVLITFIISLFTKSEPSAVSNRLTNVLEGGAPWELVLVFMLATIWAPIVEESIFRGCLFRHFRRRFPLVLAALGSAAVFAALHGYLIQQLFMVGALGFWFALMREWRGNIIATATAHAIHNGFVLSILLFTLSFAKG